MNNSVVTSDDCVVTNAPWRVFLLTYVRAKEPSTEIMSAAAGNKKIMKKEAQLAPFFFLSTRRPVSFDEVLLSLKR